MDRNNFRYLVRMGLDIVGSACGVGLSYLGKVDNSEILYFGGAVFTGAFALNFIFDMAGSFRTANGQLEEKCQK